MVGIERIKDDPFASDRADLEQYEALVKTVKVTVEKFESALEHLGGLHGEMIGALKRFHEFNEDIAQRKRIDAIAHAIESIDEKAATIKDDRELLSRKLESLAAMHTGLSLRLVDRDKAHASKAHYESKLAELAAKEKDAEKIDRNKKKQEEANAEFAKTEDVTVRECRDALNTRFKDIDQVAGLYVKILSAFFTSLGAEFEAIKSFPDQMMISQVRVVESPAVPVSMEHVQAAKVAEHAAADDDHNALRSALGLRMKRNGSTTDARQVSDDNESDLVTPASPH